MPSFTMAAWCSTEAYPYAQAIVRLRPSQGFALAGAGGGGGAAQLFPAELLGPIVCRAEAALVSGRPPDAALRTLFDGIQAEIAALTEGSSTGAREPPPSPPCAALRRST